MEIPKHRCAKRSSIVDDDGDAEVEAESEDMLHIVCCQLSHHSLTHSLTQSLQPIMQHKN